MSAETKDALDEAIAAHFGTEWDGAILTGYILQMSGVTSEDIESGEQHSYFRETANGQAAHVTLGLLDYSHTTYRAALSREAFDD